MKKISTIQNEDIKIEDIKNEDIKIEDIKNEDIKIEDIKNEDIKNISYKIKMTGFLIMLIGLLGVIDTISFRIVWNQELIRLIYNSWYQFIYIILYVLGVVYGIKLTKRKYWTINFTLVLIYIIHFLVIFIEGNIRPPIIMLYTISILSLIALVLLIVTKKNKEIIWEN